MANKTNPIGVRFNKGLLEQVMKENSIPTAQKALILYESKYLGITGEIEDKKEAEPDNKNDEIIKQILEIRGQSIPSERNTPTGKKVWEFDQHKKIENLLKQLK